MHFLKTRYYNPETERFISRDRFAWFDNDPSRQNRYVYCSNDPVNNVDLTGYWILNTIGAVIGAAAFGGIAYLVGRAMNLSSRLCYLEVRLF